MARLILTLHIPASSFCCQAINSVSARIYLFFFSFNKVRTQCCTFVCSEDVICVLFGVSGATHFILWVIFYPFILLLF